jgi:hypothetical protein
LSVFSFILVVSFSGCDTIFYKQGNGEMVINRIEVQPFREVRINGNFEVFLKKDQDQKVVLKIDENLQNDVIIKSERGVLIVDTKERIRSSNGIKVFIGYNELDKIRSGGACSVFTENDLIAEDLVISMSRAGIMELDVIAANLSVTLSGAGMLNLRGSTETLELSMSGAGSFEGERLETRDASVQISGVGGAKVHVSGNLDASVSGIGGIEYMGDPENVIQQVSGIGKIHASD